MFRLRSLSVSIILVVVALWVVTPMARAMLLLRQAQHGIAAAPVIAGIPGIDAHFYTGADDNNPIPISGWLYVVKTNAPTVILVPGWKDDRTSMLDYANFIVRGGLNVLMIDLQGSGRSGGEFSLGLHEPLDVTAAVAKLDSLPQIANHHYGVYGVSFGAGVAIAAAGGNGALYPGSSEIVAVVADSPWATEDSTIDRLNSIPLGVTSIPLPHSVDLFGHHVTFLPDAQWAVDSTLGGNPDTRSALAGARSLTANQSLLIIHEAGDSNSTTSQAAAEALYDAAKVTHKQLWLAPKGGHAGALAAMGSVYETKVLDFLQKYLVEYKDPPASATPTAYPGALPGGQNTSPLHHVGGNL